MSPLPLPSPLPLLPCPHPAPRRLEKAERRAQLKKEGKLLTGKAKAEAERLARAREAFLRQAGLDPDAVGERAPAPPAVCAQCPLPSPPSPSLRVRKRGTSFPRRAGCILLKVHRLHRAREPSS